MEVYDELRDHSSGWVIFCLLTVNLGFTLAALECACPYGCKYTELCRPVGNCNKRNVALGRPATISSLYNGTGTSYNQVSGPACLAVNGDTDTIFRPINQYPDSPNCVHTEVNSIPPYWQVDLGQVYIIDNITLYARAAARNQFRNVTIAVDDRECYKFPNLSDIEFNNQFSDVINIICKEKMQGQTVKIFKSTDLLMFCEVQVWVECDKGVHGLSCTDCGHCKVNTSCDAVTRRCVSGCDSGWSGDTCDKACPPGS